MPSTPATASRPTGRATGQSRRSFLRLLAVGSAALASCGLAGIPPTPLVNASATNGPPTPPRPPALPTPPGVRSGRLSAINDLYVKSYQHTLEPISRQTWQLSLGGQVRQPLTLKWTDLQALPIVEQMQTLECIGNPVGGRLIGNLVWRGVRLRDVLAWAHPTSASNHLVMSGADDYFTCVPLQLALDERSLLAFEVGGEPLPSTHGYPARVLLPGVYGQKQPKWVSGLAAVTGPQPGTWERQGWSDEATIQVNSRIDYPPDGSLIPLGQNQAISGVAFADTSGVARVEVSVDNGQHWSEAAIYPGPTSLVWTTWQWNWTAPTAGEYTIKVRATTGAGHTQTDAGGFLSGVFPNGTTSIHSIRVRV